jgi:hypothetical protein
MLHSVVLVAGFWVHLTLLVHLALQSLVLVHLALQHVVLVAGLPLLSLLLLLLLRPFPLIRVPFTFLFRLFLLLPLLV